MKERRLREIERVSKERDMLLRMISLFTHNEDYYGRLEFYERYGVDELTLSHKVVLVLKERLKEEEDYLKHLLYETE